jgi:hypothetical protein
MRDYGRAAVSSVHTNREVINTVTPSPGGALYDKLLISHAGYVEGVNPPINHKDAVITEILRVLGESTADGVRPEK